MGFWISKNQKPPELKSATQKKAQSLDPEELLLAKIRKTLNQDLETFLLNNIMLSVQFFDCFEREIGILRVSSAKENYPGIAEYRRHCIAPHRLYDSVAKHVQFRPQHGELSYHNELLHTRKLLVVHDNAEVMETRDSEYSSPCYRFTMESVAKHRAGYTKLRAEESSIPSIRRPTYETIDDVDEGVYTRISTDFPEERDIKDLKNSEEEESLGKDATVAADDQQNGFESQERADRRVSSMLDLQQENKAESVVTYSRKMSTKRVFGPQKPESEALKNPNSELTRTERRLSGIIKSYKMSNMNSIARAQKLQVLKSAHSLPNLTLPFANSGRTDKSSSSPKNSGDSSGYKSEGGSPNHNNLSPPRSHSSDSDYGYATIIELSTPKPLQQHRLGHIPKDISEIPKECFNTREVPLLNVGDNSSYKARRSLFESRCYLNSIIFMRSFADVFVEKLALPLGFSSSLNSATLQGSRVYCDVVQSGPDTTKPLKVLNEVTPTIFSPIWPKEALKWKTRTRNRMPDPRPGAMTWPTHAMIDHVQRLGCHLLPQGYMPTRGQNNEQYLEWQVAFPDAERYLETCLTHSQIRCLLFSMTLYKTFLEPVNTHLGLHPMHFRTLLFWQCERNFAWPEDRPGVTFMKFLDKMYEALMSTNLSDYFIPRRNLFESTPRSHLLTVQEKLLRIRENPVMHILIAIRNLRYVNTSFYPVLDCKRLYKIITSENLPVLLNLNSRLPPLPVPIAPKAVKQEESEESEESEGEEDDSNIDVWKPDLDNDAQHRWKKKVRNQIEIERAARQLTNPTPTKPHKPSVEFIDIRVQPRKGAEPLRKKALLDFFITHFIEMAKKSNTFRATRQAQFYLKHTELLVKLLAELEDHEPRNSQKYASEIREISNTIARNPMNSYATGTQLPSTSSMNSGANKTVSKPQPKNLPNLQKRNSKVQILDTHKVNPFREKTEPPSNNPTSILKKAQKLDNRTVTSAEVHKTDSGPPSPRIVIDTSKSKPLDASLIVNEVVTAESTDF